jgi:hypothetical protein
LDSLHAPDAWKLLLWLVEDGIKFSHNQNFLCPSASQFMNGGEC